MKSSIIKFFFLVTYDLIPLINWLKHFLLVVDDLQVFGVKLLEIL